MFEPQDIAELSVLVPQVSDFHETDAVGLITPFLPWLRAGGGDRGGILRRNLVVSTTARPNRRRDVILPRDSTASQWCETHDLGRADQSPDRPRQTSSPSNGFRRSEVQIRADRFHRSEAIVAHVAEAVERDAVPGDAILCLIEV